MTPINPNNLAGVVEVPELVECLTTNKCDFLRDPNSLQKYYKHRTAIQGPVLNVLAELGEIRQQKARPDRDLDQLQKEIDKVVSEILPDFPELAPLFGRRKSSAPVDGLMPDSNGDLTATEEKGTDVATGDRGGPGSSEGIEGTVGGPLDGTHFEPDSKASSAAKEHPSRRKRPGLMIGFDEETGGDEIAWLRGSTLYINALHPGYKRVRKSGSADLYVTFTVAATLATQVEEGRSPFEFLQRFICIWGTAK